MQSNNDYVLVLNPDEPALMGTAITPLLITPEIQARVFAEVRRLDRKEMSTRKCNVLRTLSWCAVALITAFAVLLTTENRAEKSLMISGYFASLVISGEFRFLSSFDSFCSFRCLPYQGTVRSVFYRDVTAIVLFTTIAYIFSATWLTIANTETTRNIHTYVLGTAGLLLGLSILYRVAQKQCFPPKPRLSLQERCENLIREAKYGG